MRVLIINTVGFKQNGMTNVIIQQFTAIDGEKCQCDIAGQNAPVPDLSKSVNKKNRQIIILPNRKKKLFNYMIELYKVCKTNNYDVMYVHGNSSTMLFEMLVAKLVGIKTRVVHGHSISSEHMLFHKFLRIIMLSLSTHRVVCSDMAGQFLCGKTKYTVIPNSFDMDKFAFNPSERENVREELGIRDRIVIGYVATLTKNKNHDFLLDVIFEYKKTHDNVMLLLVGKGPCEKDIKEKVESLKLKSDVIMLGERSDVNKMINAFDYVLFPSKYEGLGIALLEAQTNGLPVIATADTIPSEVKVNNNFHFCKLGDAKEWSKELSNLSSKRDENGYTNMLESMFSKEKQCELWQQLVKSF